MTHFAATRIDSLRTCLARVHPVLSWILLSWIPLLLLIGAGSLPAAAQPISTGPASCAILSDGSLKCWGYNGNGGLGQGDTNARGDDAGEMGDNLLAIDLGTGRSATTVQSAYLHTCAILDDNSVKCWGANGNGQLGQGDTDDRGDGAGEMGDNLPAIDLGTGRSATALATGRDHTCAILDDNSVKCWGLNASGQLGQGDTNDRGDGTGEMGNNLTAIDLGTGRSATALAAGETHTCAILDDNSVKCWGYNGYGQLGQGDTNRRGNDAGEMGDNLPAIDLGSGRSATALATGENHTCAILDDNSAKCWGYNTYGQLGQGDANHRGDAAGEMGDDLTAIDLGTGRSATALATGQRTTCSILDDNSVKCWGRNADGQLGQGDTNTRGDEANEMGDDLPAIDLGTDRAAQAITGGLYRNHCALLDDSSVKCWGYNRFGQLGQGDTNDRGDDDNEMGDNLSAVELSSPALPVELSAFEATSDGTSVLLRWRTASETNNAGFGVQQRDADGSAWRVLAFVEGRGTTNDLQKYQYRTTMLAPGPHTFRLRQVDLDGTTEYSPEVEVQVGLSGKHVLTAPSPNPFTTQSVVRFGVEREQHVQVTLYNALGQQVRTLFSGPASAGRMEQVQINGRNLTSGMYLLRIQGERFAKTQSLTLVK